jgi:hypothetical protein
LGTDVCGEIYLFLCSLADVAVDQDTQTLNIHPLLREDG